MSSKFQDSFGAGYTFQETLPCTNKIVELKIFVLCVSIRLNKHLTTYILSLTLNPNQAFHRAADSGITVVRRDEVGGGRLLGLNVLK